ncbi:MAG: SDR family NAD(P)-dependent oxidoreductase [Deltaproteobacteria bacterium]|nr:SDR family NAD(P)-dependent oxidoreductase [Deltaproteobacteria bacterium]
MDLKGRVAVVTGAGSGIGRAMAERFAAAGMHLALADIEAEPLAVVADALRERGCEVEAERLDVRDSAALEALAVRCFSRFGGAHVLCNNAGVASGGPVWEISEEDWDWVIGVNLVAVVHGIRAFVPKMIASGEPGHIVNTASIAGLTCPAFMSPYTVTKHAVVALSDTLRSDLAMSDAMIGVSVLCPGWVRTRIHESDRNRPGGEADASEELSMMRELVDGFIAGGIDPADVAEQVHDAVVNGQFWIRTHPEMEPMVAKRCEAIIAGEPPPPMLPTDIK